MTPLGTRIAAAMLAVASVAPFASVPASAQDGQTGNPVGTWLTESGHGVIRFAPCEAGLCGSIVGIDRAQDEPMPTDVQGRSQCGLTIFTGSAEQQDGVTEGHITDPRNGKTYQAQVWVDPTGRLHLRGYVGVPLLGATQIWRPFQGHIAEDCRFT
ncbi:MAG: DUF2147 domain-containing protein [Proteobacteria bacterium]|nr:DUF2147 domain-containing protein [Pseudomonadota bacterium]